MFENQIKNYIGKTQLFTTGEIQDQLGVNKEQKAVFNTELARMEKKGRVVRIMRGLYAVPETSVFGEALPDDSVIVSKIYIENGNGYISGPTFLNQIGLSTWMPAKVYVKSNNYRRKMAFDFFMVTAPVVKITDDNKPYLQLLDALSDMQKYATDQKDPEKILCHYIRKTNMDVGLLLAYAHKYYKQGVIEALYKMVEKEYYEIT